MDIPNSLQAIEENLRILMDSYEEERRNLEEFIRQFLSEDELKYAHYHHKALIRLNKNIGTLKTLENPIFYLTEMHQDMIRMWEENLKEAQLDGLPTDYISQNLGKGSKSFDFRVKMNVLPLNE